MKKFEKYDWDNGDKNYYKFGDDIVCHGMVMYSYDDNCWRYAPDLYYEYNVQTNEFDKISKAEARSIVEKNGGTKFDDTDKVLFATDEDGKYSALD